MRHRALLIVGVGLLILPLTLLHLIGVGFPEAWSGWVRAAGWAWGLSCLAPILAGLGGRGHRASR